MLSSSNEDVVLVVDIGSSSVRCSAYNLSGSSVVGCRVQLHHSINEDSTFNATELLHRINEAVEASLQHLESTRLRVVAVGFACFGMNLVGVDERGRPVTPVLTYARSGPSVAAHVECLRAKLEVAGELQETMQRTGTPLHSSYAAAQLSWFAEAHPGQLDKVAHWQTVPSLVLANWTGSPYCAVSYSEASWTGLLNRRELCWDERLLAHLPSQAYKDKMPPLADFGDARHRLRVSERTARSMPRLAGAMLFLGIGDGAAANIGSRCFDSSRIAITVGTSAAVRVIVPASLMDDADVPEGLWCYRVDRDRTLLGGALTDGGSVHAWACSVMGYSGCSEQVSERQRSEEVAAISPTSHGLTALPFLSGERAPGWCSNARMVVAGITRATTAAHLHRCLLESVALRIRAIYDRVSPFANEGAMCIVSGTALDANETWRQIVADVLGQTLYLSSQNEATSRGVALLISAELEPSSPRRTRTFSSGSAFSGGDESPPRRRHARRRSSTVRQEMVTPILEAHTAYCEAAHLQQQLYKSILGEAAYLCNEPMHPKTRKTTDEKINALPSIFREHEELQDPWNDSEVRAWTLGLSIASFISGVILGGFVVRWGRGFREGSYP